MLYNTPTTGVHISVDTPQLVDIQHLQPTCRIFQQLLDGTQLAGVELPVERLVAAGVTLSDGSFTLAASGRGGGSTTFEWHGGHILERQQANMRNHQNLSSSSLVVIS